MKLLFLGAGSAFTLDKANFHSNMLLLADNGEKLLIDCGSDARFSLFEQGYTYKDISDVYISHLHADHAGGLEWLAFSTKFDPSCQKPTLHIHKTLAPSLWQNVLYGGLSSISGEVVNLSSFFNVNTIKMDKGFHWQNIYLQLVQMLHVPKAFSIAYSYGVFFTVNRKTIFITTDTQFSPHLYEYYYKNADLIFHDCETALVPSTVHSHYQELCTLPDDIKSKIWLYHYNSGEKPDAKSDGFLGFVAKGQVFEL